jgi:peptidoglycan L-alanyl-D-glutamate endopeptidase CwlK
MNTLRDGASGADVILLQTRLKEHGFPPGAIDGVFGPGTEAAVIGFQRSQGLLADGVVGSITASALGFGSDEAPAPPGFPPIDLALVAKMFPATRLDNIKSNLPHVIAALQEQNLVAIPVVLTALATIRAETEGFLPIDEGMSRFNTSPGGRPFDLYDHRADLGNQGPTDGADYKGRGFVQLTGRANYERFGPIVEADLVRNPELANEPTTAARLLAAFISSKQLLIKDALLRDDLAAARKAVNGGSHGLDRFSAAYRIGQSLLAGAV